MVLSMDALFGLPRKKKAGKSVREPLFGQTFFLKQDEVDDHHAKVAKMKIKSNNTRV